MQDMNGFPEQPEEIEQQLLEIPNPRQPQHPQQHINPQIQQQQRAEEPHAPLQQQQQRQQPGLNLFNKKLLF